MKYFIITYGCQMNYSDSEKIAGILESQGHKPAKNDDEANLIVLNCCSVRAAAIHRVYAKVEQFKKKKIILAGCLIEKDKNYLKHKVSEIWHPDKYFTCSPQKINSPQPPLESRGGEGVFSIAYVLVMTGCNNFCSYCVVPYTRGREKSRAAEEIMEEVKSLIEKGYKEIMLLGQNVNSYRSTLALCPEQAPLQAGRVEGNPSTPPRRRGSAQEIDFPALLRLICALQENFQISFLTSHPKDMSDELIKIVAKCDKIKPEIHLPVQSGDNSILKKMNRKYTVGHYKQLAKKLRAAFKKYRPGVIPKITTDIIVGFPGETKKQFQNTMKLAKEINFDGAFIAKYSPRPGTAAAKMKDDVPIEEKKRRWRILDTLINKYEH